MVKRNILSNLFLHCQQLMNASPNEQATNNWLWNALLIDDFYLLLLFLDTVINEDYEIFNTLIDGCNLQEYSDNGLYHKHEVVGNYHYTGR